MPKSPWGLAARREREAHWKDIDHAQQVLEFTCKDESPEVCAALHRAIEAIAEAKRLMQRSPGDTSERTSRA